MVSAGAKILGSLRSEKIQRLGAGSVVLEEVPLNCTVVGVPGRIVKMDNKKFRDPIWIKFISRIRYCRILRGFQEEKS